MPLTDLPPNRFIDSPLDIGLGLETNHLMDQFAFFEKEERRDSLNSVFLSGLRIFIHIQFSDFEAACIGLCDFFDDGCKCSARRAPLRPKIH